MMVAHHVKYEELHGVDEVVMMEKGAHRQLHNRLRQERKCNVSADTLRKISTTARNRSEYSKSGKYDYHKRSMQPIYFNETLMPNVGFQESIRYNQFTGCVTCTSLFRGYHGKKLLYIDIM